MDEYEQYEYNHYLQTQWETEWAEFAGATFVILDGLKEGGQIQEYFDFRATLDPVILSWYDKRGTTDE